MTDTKTNEADVTELEVTEEITFEEQIQESNIEGQVAVDEEVRKSRIDLLSNLSLNVQPIVHWPDERLKQVSTPLSTEEISAPETDQLLADMFTTLAAEQGIGLSAIQIDVPKRVAVFDFNGKRMVLINPELVSVGDDMMTIKEGCISVPGVYHDNKRPSSCIVKYIDINTGNTKEIQLSGVYAFAIQHEIDHMDGKVFVEEFSFLKRSLWKNKVKKIVNKRTKHERERLND